MKAYQKKNSEGCAATLAMHPADFFSHLVKRAGCPRTVSISEAAWNLLLAPLYKHMPTPSNGNSKLAEILYKAALALQSAQRNGAEFEMAKEAVGNMPTSKVFLEVFMDEGKNKTPTMEIGIAGERKLKFYPEKLEKAATQPVYFALDAIGNRT